MGIARSTFYHERTQPIGDAELVASHAGITLFGCDAIDTQHQPLDRVRQVLRGHQPPCTNQVSICNINRI